MDKQIEEGEKSPGAPGWKCGGKDEKLVYWSGLSKYGQDMNPKVNMVRAEYYFPTIDDPQFIFDCV